MRSFLLALLISVAFADIFRYETAWKQKYIQDFENVDHVKAWENWKITFDKHYKGIGEESHRFVIWLKNWERINSFNSIKRNYTVGMNQFGDLTDEEFRYYVHGHDGSCLASKPAYKKANTKYYDPSKNSNVELPATVNWVNQGVVTGVKNQGSCGSCWAFSTTGAIECRDAIATGKLISLSEQELVDCSGSYGNYGCSGGLMDNAFRYVEANKGLCTEAEYPYTGVDGTCVASSCSHYDPIAQYSDVVPDSDAALATAISTGCVSVAIEADQFSFQYYSGGVLDTSCGASLDHGVLAVGYGTDATTGLTYWLVKNSWGTSWGMEGYVEICRSCQANNGAGECGILSEPSYPLYT